MATPNTDFGSRKYSSVFICHAAIKHPLAANLSERIKITADRQLQGWAKPGAQTVVVATVGGDSTKAVMFAYNKGDMMATREAAHRRVGFLPSIPAGAGPADEPQWRLFDAAARWAAEGGGPTESDAGVGHWFLKDG